MLTLIDRLTIVWAIFLFAMLAILVEPTPDTGQMLRYLFWPVMVPWAFLRGLRWALLSSERHY